VLFAYRDYIYNPKANKNELEIIIAKNRHGGSNIIEKLHFNLAAQRVTNV
jgi:replicative DNA helicase